MEIIKWFKQVETTFTHCYGCTPGFFQSVTIGPRQTWGGRSQQWRCGQDPFGSSKMRWWSSMALFPWYFYIFLNTTTRRSPSSSDYMDYLQLVTSIESLFFFFRFLALSRPQASWGTHKLLAPILRPPATSTSCASGCWWMLMLYIGWITFRRYPLVN